MLLEKFYIWLAWRLPVRLVRWCAVRVVAHATTGRYSGTVVPSLTIMEAMKRWEQHTKEREGRCEPSTPAA